MISQDALGYKEVCQAIAAACQLPDELVAQYVKRLRPAQFERLLDAVTMGRNEEQHAAAIRIALALVLAQEAVLLAQDALADVGRMPADFSVEGLTLERIDQALALAVQVKLGVDLARALLPELVQALENRLEASGGRLEEESASGDEVSPASPSGAVEQVSGGADESSPTETATGAAPTDPVVTPAAAPRRSLSPSQPSREPSPATSETPAGQPASDVPTGGEPSSSVPSEGGPVEEVPITAPAEAEGAAPMPIESPAVAEPTVSEPAPAEPAPAATEGDEAAQEQPVKQEPVKEEPAPRRRRGLGPQI